MLMEPSWVRKIQCILNNFMSIGNDQISIIKLSKSLLNKDEKFFPNQISALNYFALWGTNPGFERIKINFYNFKNILNFVKQIAADILNITYLKEFYILKKIENERKKNIKKIIISRSLNSDFNKDGSYFDRYFRISSKKKKNFLFFLIHQDLKIPKKINENIILILPPKKEINIKNLFFLLKYLTKKLISVHFSIKKFFYVTSSFLRKSELIIKIIEKELNIKDVNSVLLPYEGQPYEDYIIKILKKKNNNLITKGYDHSAPHSIPLHLLHKKNSPDILIVNGSSQLNFLVKKLKWPRKKIKISPSIRYPKSLDLGLKNKVFLPYEIFNEKIILSEFQKIVKTYPKEYFNKLEIKNHPMMEGSSAHKKLKFELEKLINKKRNQTFKKKSKKNISFFIGPTTGVIVALEKKIQPIHICFNKTFDSYSSKLWPNLNVKSISKNSFVYSLKKNNSFLKFAEKKDIFEKYYDF